MINQTLVDEYIRARELIFAGDCSELESLLARTPSLVDFRDSDSGSTLLHQALSAPSGAPPEHAIESIRLLVSAGADIDAPDANGAGKTVLELAAERNLSEVVAAVCELGARIDPHPDRQSSESAASLACVNGNTDLARSLVKRGAQVSLSIAAAIGDIDTLEAMLDDAGRLSRLTATVETAQKIRQELALPFMFACTNGQLESAFFLIRRGADVNLACAAAGTEVSASGLHWAARHGHFELVKFLINYGADLRAVDGTMKQTASQWAKEANFDRIHDYIEHLKKRG